MVNKKIILRLSNEIGNQMFMYASAFSISKKLNRSLLLDNETAYLSRKNISKYGLNNFKITSEIASSNYKFLGTTGYIKRKILKKINSYLKSKIFFVEHKDFKKNTKFNNDIYNCKLSDKVYLEGYFESEKYFLNIKDKIFEEFSFLNKTDYIKSLYYKEISKKNSVSVCLRQNRFIEGKKRNNQINQNKSVKFKNEQIEYINRSISYIKNIVDKPTFFLWSNDISNIEENLFNEKVNKVVHDNVFQNNIDKRLLDLFLISQCNHHIVIPSSFNWWGAWLCDKKDKIITRPSDTFFTEFKLNNKDFWPEDWIIINE